MLLVLFVFMLVLSFVNLNQLLEEREVAHAGTELKSPTQTALPPQTDEEESRDELLSVNVWNTAEEKMQEVSLHDYLIGVVSGEMPATFEMEALKAQAVAARTYTLSHLQPYGTTRCATNPEANVCTNAQCCHAYSTVEQMQAKWGEEFEEKYEKIRKAVEETDGEYMCYDGDVITVFYFSTSNGYTEGCEDVFVKNLPYYKSVESPGEELAPRYYSYTLIAYDEFLSELKENFDIDATVSELTEQTYVKEYTQGGRVAVLSICGKEIKGTAFRSALGLRSADFIITYNEDSVLIEMYGNGHGVGMSQLGAQAMAEDGADYTEILLHYYIDVDIVNL